MTTEVSAPLPSKLKPLFDQKRYKIIYGGRAGAKSWSIATALLIMGVQRKLRICCFREIQHSIADSVHQLLRNRILELQLDGVYRVRESYIEGANGTLITFHGLKQASVTNIKSLEGADYAWVEEAQTVTSRSWEVLIPTIRKEHSEIWMSLNPELETDPTYQRFIKNPPDEAILIEMSSEDNPFLTSVMVKERDELKRRDPVAYEHVWGGKCRLAIEGAIYGRELREAVINKRITKVPYQIGLPVHVIFDLGFADATAIWFVQRVGFEWNLIDYYEDRGYLLEHYLKEVRNRGYVIGMMVLPHDGKNETVQGLSAKAQAEAAGFTVHICPDHFVSEGIDAARRVFPICNFDEAKCKEGLDSLRHYRFKVDPDTKQFSLNPDHYWSDGADSFRYFAVSLDALQTSMVWAKAPKLKYAKVTYV